MTQLMRMSLAIEPELYDQMDALVKQRGCANRSEFVRALLREKLVEKALKADQEALGTITIIYDHSKRRLGEKLTEEQHQHHHHVLASTHVHLDQHLCAEMIMVRGKAGQIKSLADRLSGQKGVLHASLAISGAGQHLS